LAAGGITALVGPNAAGKSTLIKNGDWHTTEPFSAPESFPFPEGIGPVECVNVEHEEVLLLPRWLETRKATFKYALGADFIDKLKTITRWAWTARIACA